MTLSKFDSLYRDIAFGIENNFVGGNNWGFLAPWIKDYEK